jgi:SAM-dependent methyltransferase
MDSGINAFNQYAGEYDKWFDRNPFAYESELLAIKRFLPRSGKGLEIGVGTGKFAVPLGIKVGIEPAKAMADIARQRGIEVHEAVAENLPFQNGTFDFALMVTVLCFLHDPQIAIEEIARVLKPGGSLILGMIDGESFLGKIYESKKAKNLFYQDTHFYSVPEVIDMLKRTGFIHLRTCQTIFRNPHEFTVPEAVEDGFGKGGFVALSGEKAP